MASSTPVSIVRYCKSMQGRQTFNCGVESLNRFIAQHATQSEKRDLARVFVALDQDTCNIVGYYSLNATSIIQDSFPENIAKKLIREVPAVLLGRLAVHESHQKKGLGKHLMMNAFERVCEVNDGMATQSLIVDAINESVADYYIKRYNFNKLRENGLRLFLPFSEIRKTIQESNTG